MSGKCASEINAPVSIEKSIHKYKVVVGCMVCLAVVLGALLFHGAIRALAHKASVFTVLYTLGFCVLFAAPLLVWNAYNYLQYIEKRERRGGYLNVAERDFRVVEEGNGTSNSKQDLSPVRETDSHSPYGLHVQDISSAKAAKGGSEEHSARRRVASDEGMLLKHVQEADLYSYSGSIAVQDISVGREGGILKGLCG